MSISGVVRSTVSFAVYFWAVGLVLAGVGCTKFKTPVDAGGGSGGGGASGSGGSGGSQPDGTTDSSNEAPEASCTDTASDPKNCGSCGHDCLGGMCSAGVCQPFVLGTAASDFARDLFVLEGQAYVFAEAATVSRDSKVWQLDANTSSTPFPVGGVPGNVTLGCVMGGKLFWLVGGSPASIYSCSLANCATTARPVVTGISDFAYLTVCDTTSNEVVWLTQSGQSAILNTLFRASSDGSAVRPVTSFMFDGDGSDWRLANESGHFSNGRPDRVFFVRNNSTSNNGTLYYISTMVSNASRVPVFTATGAIATNGAAVLANDTTVIASIFPTGTTTEILRAPLPNGIISGSAPVLFAGAINGGVLDKTYFYGIVGGSTVPDDAVIRCQLSDCSNPTVLFRGQGGASYFAQDGSAFYWTKANTTAGQGFDVWKAAK